MSQFSILIREIMLAKVLKHTGAEDYAERMQATALADQMQAELRDLKNAEDHDKPKD